MGAFAGLAKVLPPVGARLRHSNFWCVGEYRFLPFI